MKKINAKKLQRMGAAKVLAACVDASLVGGLVGVVGGVLSRLFGLLAELAFVLAESTGTASLVATFVNEPINQFLSL